MARLSNWTFVIENKPGVGGNIGLDLIARAHADGYTLGMGQTSNLAINPAIMTNMPFDPVRDIVPVAMVAEVPMLLVVQAQSSFNTVTDLIAAAKQKNGGLKQGVSGLGTVGHLAGEMLALQAGYKVLIVPYKGASPALTDLMGGQTDFMLATPQGLMPLIKSGKLRVLAVTSAKRLAFLPNIPTLAESGFKEFQATDWKLVVAPANTPTPILEKLNQLINEALQNKDFIRQLDNEGSTPMGGSLVQAKQFVAQQQEQWATLIKQTSLKF
jgi:tripartite-type tricarboxylate transporter receptor subunit TctC